MRIPPPGPHCQIDLYFASARNVDSPSSIVAAAASAFLLHTLSIPCACFWYKSGLEPWRNFGPKCPQYPVLYNFDPPTPTPSAPLAAITEAPLPLRQMTRTMEAKDKSTLKMCPPHFQITSYPPALPSPPPPPLTMCYVYLPAPFPGGFSAREQNGVACAKESSACLLQQDDARGGVAVLQPC